MSQPLAIGERLFAAYLRQQRLSYDREPLVGTRRPDFVVDHGRLIGRVAWEIYAPVLALPNRSGAVDPYSHIRNAFNGRKREQAQACRKAGVPYVLVLSSENSALSFDPVIVAGAMFGDVGFTWSVPLDPDAAPSSPSEATFLGGGRLQQSRNRSVSAVAVLTAFNPTQWKVDAAIAQLARRRPSASLQNERERAAIVERIFEISEELQRGGAFDPEARVARIKVLHNPHAQLPLDPSAAAGPHDEQWSTVPPSRYALIATGRRWQELPGSRSTTSA